MLPWLPIMEVLVTPVWQSLANGDPDLFVEVVRFEETRKYLMSIYEIFNIYSRLYARVP
jgi:soluble lytic murein transglycosylase